MALRVWDVVTGTHTGLVGILRVNRADPDHITGVRTPVLMGTVTITHVGTVHRSCRPDGHRLAQTGVLSLVWSQVLSATKSRLLLGGIVHGNTLKNT